MADNHASLGGKVPERYVVKKLIGQGAYGKVYEVIDSQDNNARAAMKLIEKTRADNVVKSAQVERDLMLQMSHKNVVGILGHFENEHYVAMLLEFCPYGDLYDLCHQKSKIRKFNEASASHIIGQCMEALEYVHSMYLVHGDLKPENILIKDIKKMTVCIADFGLSLHRQRMTWLKKRCGSPYFMAPEKFNLHTSEASDIWAIGIIGFEMIFGYVPWESKNCKEQQEALKIHFQNIVQKGKGPWFPKDVLSDKAREFLFLLLQYEAGGRLTAAEARNHPFLQKKKKKKKKKKKRESAETEAEVEPEPEPETQKKFDKNFQALLICNAKLNKFRGCVAKLMINTMTPASLKLMHENFKAFDSNDDGIITLEKFKEAFIGRSDFSEDQINLLCETLDLPASGTVSYEKIMAQIAYNHVATQDDRIVEFYKSLEEDHKVISMKKLLDLHKEHPELPGFKSSFNKVSFEEAWIATMGNIEVSRKSFHENLFDEIGDDYSGTSTYDSI